MGGTGLYHPPTKVKPTGFASYETHTNRGTPSTEPGLDCYVPRFTELFAAASGRVVAVYYGIGEATGRYITIDLDDGRRVRYLHLEEIYVTVGQRVAWGELIGKTGATGYGEADWSWNVAETGGAHVHMTVFPGHFYVFGRYATLDPYPLIDWTDEDDMFTDDDRAMLMDLTAAAGAGNARFIPIQDQDGRSILAHVRAAVTQGYRILEAVGNVGDVDEAAIAKALAPLLAEHTGALDSLSDAELEKIAAKTADVIAKRLAQ